MKKRLLSILLALCMVVSLFTVTAFAAEPVAKIGTDNYGTIKEALVAAASVASETNPVTVQLMAGTIEEGTIKFPAKMSNVTIKGADDMSTIIKNSRFMSSDGNTVHYEDITINGIVFDSSDIVFTGARNGEVIYKDWVITNCEFKNITKNDNISAVHFNLASDETIENFTFTNNTISGVLGATDAVFPGGLRANYLSGDIVVTGNSISNVCNNAIQFVNVDADSLVFEKNSLASNEGAIANLYNTVADEVSIVDNQFHVQDSQKGISNITGVDVSGNYWGGEAPAYLPEGVTCTTYYESVNTDGTLADSAFTESVVAVIGNKGYTTLQEALKNVKANETIKLLKDITITEDWDERYTGGRITVDNVTIDGDGHKITFNCDIQDGANYCAPFRVHGNNKATFQNLTLDLSQATNSKFSRLRAISSGSGDLTVTNCTLIGNPAISNSRAIIFDEGAGDSPETDINISGCTFIDWRYGVTDNENGKDVGTVTISDNSFIDAGVQISASEEITFTDNEMTDSKVSITSYTNAEDIQIDATGNKLDADQENKIKVPITENDMVDSGFAAVIDGEDHFFVSFDLPEDAKVEVYDADGKVCVPVNGSYLLSDGTYTYTVSKYGYFDVTGSFTVTDVAQTVTVSRMTAVADALAMIVGAEAPAARFVDVDANAWYYDAVNYVLNNGLMNGVGEDTFAPNGTMTRAMVWTVLGRMAGQDFDGTGANWYVEAQNWAIVNGISDGTNPNGAITREELVTMLWRFVDAPVAAENALQWYGDEASVADWAADAMNWAVNRQIIEGANWNLNPQATALRCQVAAILMRYCG